ncbi:hypothetical protein [Wolbachia pipientis]|uniref:hypothetical protein n=1 Tax=Wolbachia pipientis TaxID=955 RepID=UPI0038B4A70F
MNLLYITHYPKSCATKPTGIHFFIIIKMLYFNITVMLTNLTGFQLALLHRYLRRIKDKKDEEYQ